MKLIKSILLILSCQCQVIFLVYRTCQIMYHDHTYLRAPPSILIKYKRIVTPDNILIVLMNRRFD